MIMKIVVILLLVMIIYCLGSAVVFMIRGKRKKNMVKALTWRISLSLLLFILILIGYAMGWITPHAV